jgi:hypothetical protein
VIDQQRDGPIGIEAILPSQRLSVTLRQLAQPVQTRCAHHMDVRLRFAHGDQAIAALLRGHQVYAG